MNEIRQQTLDLLQHFNGLDPLKELLWSHLNYDRVKRTNITRRGWPEPVASALAEDPSLLAEGGKDGDFKILYARLAKDRLSLADERIVTTRLLKDSPYGLFVFSDRAQANWHFVNVKMADDASKRKLYRRVTVGPNEKMRTACQVISQLDLSSINANVFGLSALAIQERHDQAFDVEPVTEAFYAQYKLVFEKVEGLIRGIQDKDRKRLFTQRLFNRLMFIAFIQKKGWLQFGGSKNQDYLNALWTDYRKQGSRDMGFYNERLYQLFFHGLGAQVDYNLMKINKGGFLRDVIGKVPYLNGGLFEEDADDKDSSIKVPDEAIRSILAELFDHFNFTVTEATPLDVEVAVDPEMLGKVFEELVTGRHESGSFYTPKPIVSFMCRETLKGYLEANLVKETLEAIVQFVDGHDPSALKNAEEALEALRRVRVCDLACGSGAYLLGMLHELMDLRTCLFSVRNLDSISAYDRKLEIIQRNVYGVDLDPFAVNIARLRLWLSLSVEFEGDDPPPLPNLKFEIEEGDSLTAPAPSPTQSLMWANQIEGYSDAKARYIKAHGDEKRQLEQEVLDLKAAIAIWTHPNGPVEGFDWSVEFAEVFRSGGFDIVVANPPYVRMELFKELKPVLRRNFTSVHSDRADLYCYFYARALELLTTSGFIAFISSNKWLRAKYGGPLRKHISTQCQILSITDFGDLPVFKSATAYPMIFIGKKATVKKQDSITFTKVKTLAPPYPDVLAITAVDGHILSQDAIIGEKWMLASASQFDLINQMKSCSKPLIEIVGGKIFYGVKTGLNSAFVIDEAIKLSLSANAHCRKAIKRFVVGKDIQRWTVEDRKRFILYLHHGIDTSELKPIIDYLKPFKTDLQGRATTQAWYELQQPQLAYAKGFEKPKIVYPDIAKSCRFAFDASGSYVDCTGFVLPTSDLFLLGVLNSKAVYSYFVEVGAVVRGGYLRFKRQYMEQIPIPNATDAQKKRIIQLVQKCLDAEGDKRLDAEAELDEEVAALYGIDGAVFEGLALPGAEEDVSE